MFKNILKFLLIFISWFIVSFFVKDYTYYDSLNLPFFALPRFLFPIVWFILYFMISVSIYKIVKYNLFYDLKEYKKTLITNYIFNQLFVILFFVIKNNFISFIDCLLTFLTSLFLYYETKEINKKSSIWLIPYVLFSVYATILSMFVYFMNL